MDYLGFRRTFEQALTKLKIPSDCSLQEPNWEITLPPLCWSLEFILRFQNQKHIRIWESYDKIAGLQMSRRLQWAYHYGDSKVIAASGDVSRGGADDPLDIRIDTCSGLHMHLGAREPHYEVSRITGVKLEKIDAFTFVKAIFKHRKTQASICSVLKITIRD